MVREECGVLSRMARYNDGVLQAVARYESGVLPINTCPLPSLVRRLEVDPDPACRLTMREAEVWESPRFRAFSLARSWSRQSGVVSARPASAYAGRWQEPSVKT